jgi:hypothetical protein
MRMPTYESVINLFLSCLAKIAFYYISHSGMAASGYTSYQKMKFRCGPVSRHRITTIFIAANDSTRPIPALQMLR